MTTGMIEKLSIGLPSLIAVIMGSTGFTVWALGFFQSQASANDQNIKIEMLEKKQDSDHELLIRIDTKLDLLLKR